MWHFKINAVVDATKHARPLMGVLVLLAMAVFLARRRILSFARNIFRSLWMRVGYTNTEDTESFSRKIGLALLDESTGCWEYPMYCRPLWCIGEIRIKCPKSITPSAVAAKMRNISFHFFANESEIAFFETAGRRLRMYSHRRFPRYLFTESSNAVDKEVRKKGFRVPIYQGRTPRGIIITEGDEKTCSIAVGAPGAGKSLSLAAAHWSVRRYDPEACIMIFDASTVDYAHLSDDKTLIICTHEELLDSLNSIKAECERRRIKMIDLVKSSGTKVNSRAIFEAMTGEKLQTLVLVIDEAQLLFEKNPAKGSTQSKIIEVYKELVTAYRKFGFISFLGTVESKAGELNIPFSGVSARIAGALPFAETSRTLLGSDIAFCEALKKGRLAIRIPGEDGDLGQHGLIVQFPKSIHVESK